jgi:alpha-beta hydrolase superfamily lysophospholipase
VRALAVVLALVGFAGCATPRVQQHGAPVDTPQLEAARVRTADGAVLPLSTWQPQGTPRAVVLALHGFNDYRHAFETVGAFLAAQDIATYAYDQRGFGATSEPGIWAGSDVLVDDAAAVMALLRQRHPGRPLYVLGESMGGAVALSVLATTPAAADGAVLVAPAVWGRRTMNPLQRAALWLLAHSWPGLRLSGSGLGVTASDNKAMLRAQRDDPLVLKNARVDALWGLADLTDRGLAAAPGVTVPTLVQYGERDEIIPRRATCRLVATLASPGRVAVYPDGYHMLTRDLGARQVLEDTAAWLADSASPLPSGQDADGRLRLCGQPASQVTAATP